MPISSSSYLDSLNNQVNLFSRLLEVHCGWDYRSFELYILVFYLHASFSKTQSLSVTRLSADRDKDFLSPSLLLSTTVYCLPTHMHTTVLVAYPTSVVPHSWLRAGNSSKVQNYAAKRKSTDNSQSIQFSLE